jgi:hypothetical protein
MFGVITSGYCQEYRLHYDSPQEMAARVCPLKLK